MTRRRLLPLLLILLTVLACVSAIAAQAPKNVVLMIGDGMGIAQVTLARVSLNESSPPLNIDSMRHVALMATRSADSVVTDSAAAGTALASGFKTNNGMVGIVPDGSPVRTILEEAEARGKATGLVTNTTITHATPASFAAHVESRKSEADIAPQFLENDVNVLLGGGRMYFLPKSLEGSKREDERDLLAEAKRKGYTIVDSRDGLLSAKGSKLLGLFQTGPLNTELPEPSLAEMAQKALETLSEDEDGFFLMVEGGQIDWRCHDNDAPRTVRQVFDFDAAVGEVLDFARKRGDTLVIVTADHETGGMAIVYPSNGSNTRFKVAWTTKGHSGCDVGLFADGPGAELFTGLLDSIDIPKKIAQLWGIKGFATQE